MVSRSLVIAATMVVMTIIMSHGAHATATEEDDNTKHEAPNGMHYVPGHIGIVPSIGPILGWSPVDAAPKGIQPMTPLDGGVNAAASCDCDCVNRCLNTPFSKQHDCWKTCPASDTSQCRTQCFRCPCDCVNRCLNTPFSQSLQCWRDICPAGDTAACKAQCFKCPCNCTNKCMNMPFGQEQQCWRDVCPQGDCPKCKAECFECDCPCVNRCEVIPFPQEAACWKNCSGSHTDACKNKCHRPNCGEGSICDLCAAVCMETGGRTPERLAQCFKECNNKYKCNNWCGHT